MPSCAIKLQTQPIDHLSNPAAGSWAPPLNLSLHQPARRFYQLNPKPFTIRIILQNSRRNSPTVSMPSILRSEANSPAGIDPPQVFCTKSSAKENQSGSQPKAR